ncbi:MAG: VOC family protein [Bryobacteraceae bacterium]
MDNGFEQNEHPLIAFVPTRDPDHARAFYHDLLGLRLICSDVPSGSSDAL